MSVSVPRAARRTFSTVSGLQPVGTGRFEAEVDPAWTIGGKPNGGYLLAMLGRAATCDGTHPHVIAASAHFLRSPDPGPIAIDTETLRTGRSATQVRARMTQGEVACVEALITASRLELDSRPYWDAGMPEVSAVGWVECERLVPVLPTGQPVAIMEEVEVRLEGATRGFANGRPSGRGELRGWLALPGDEEFDPISLLFAVDAFPPATFDVEFAGWVPTLELTAYVRALPTPGPLQIIQRAQLIEAGRVDEVCYVWDSAGRLVAHGTQLAGIRLG
jgi:acyl-coenzyme A thioesterase PaaI-like protein